MDTGYPIGLLRADDANHVVARQWSAVAQRDQWQLVTTTAVLAEVGDAFAKEWHRVYSFLFGVLVDPSFDVVTVSTDLFGRALELRNQRLDKDWGLTDCISFVVMQERAIRDALAADRHFEQAGFRALLREPPPRRPVRR